jgi:hypothetical protein
MKIETLQEWNLVLQGCECCSMPLFLPPVAAHESAQFSLCGFSPEDDAPVQHPDEEERGVLYAAMSWTVEEAAVNRPTQDYASTETAAYGPSPAVVAVGAACLGTVAWSLEDERTIFFDDSKDQAQTVESNSALANGLDEGDGVSGTNELTSEEYNPDGDLIYSSSENSAVLRFYGTVPSLASGESGTWTSSTLTYVPPMSGDADEAVAVLVFSEPYSAAVAGELLAAVAPEDWPVAGNGEAVTDITAAADGLRILAARADHERIQFRVPVGHLGSFYEIAFDVVEEPEGWEESEEEARSFYERDVVKVWTGPGSGPQDDPSWNIGDAYLLPPPAVAGRRRIVNLRYSGMRGSKFGRKPQAFGPAVELEEEAGQ